MKFMLADNKHLNKTGFFTFLSELKFVLFGGMPYTGKYRKY